MPSSLRQKLFYGLHHSKKSQRSATPPQPTDLKNAAEGRRQSKSTEAAHYAPDQSGKWQDVQTQPEPETAGHKQLPEALRYLGLNDERLRTSTIERSDPTIAETRHARQASIQREEVGQGRNSGQSQASQRVSNDSSRSPGMLIGPAQDPFAEGCANKNISRNEAILAGDLHDSKAVRAALDKDRHNIEHGHRGSEEVKRSRRQIPVVEPDENSADSSVPAAAIPARSSSLRRPSSSTWPLTGASSDHVNAARRSSITQRKPLPATVPEIAISNPSRQVSQATHGNQQDSKPSSSAYSQVDNGRDFLVHDSSDPVSLASVVDLTNTVDTREYTSVAPAVTHETVVVDTHEITHQQITREIHNYDVYHRVLPILQVEVLPPRHYVPDPRIHGGLIEISPKQILGGEDAHWRMQKVMQEALDNNLHLQVGGSGFDGRRPFTARRFSSSEGDLRAFADDDGVTYTEQTWIHHPTLQDGGMKTGQTEPFHFEHSGRMDKFDLGMVDGNQHSNNEQSRHMDGSAWI